MRNSTQRCIALGSAAGDGGRIDVLASFLHGGPTVAAGCIPLDPGRLFVERAIVCDAGGRVVFNANTEILPPAGVTSTSGGSCATDRVGEDFDCCSVGSDGHWLSCFGDLSIAADPWQEGEERWAGYAPLGTPASSLASVSGSSENMRRVPHTSFLWLFIL